MLTDQDIIDTREKSFNRTLSSPAISALISTIPPSEHLEALLKEIHAAGFSTGIAMASFELMSALLGGKKDV